MDCEELKSVISGETLFGLLLRQKHLDVQFSKKCTVNFPIPADVSQLVPNWEEPFKCRLTSKTWIKLCNENFEICH